MGLMFACFGPPNYDDLCPECGCLLLRRVKYECPKGHVKSFRRLPWEGHGQGCPAGTPPPSKGRSHVCRRDGEPMKLVLEA
jgi:hypothetical protein